MHIHVTQSDFATRLHCSHQISVQAETSSCRAEVEAEFMVSSRVLVLTNGRNRFQDMMVQAMQPVDEQHRNQRDGQVLRPRTLSAVSLLADSSGDVLPTSASFH